MTDRFQTPGESRAVSVTINYILTLAISAVLVTGLLIAGGTFVEDSRERVIESELEVIGIHLASNVEQVDRMVNASESGQPDAAWVNETFQRQVTGSVYLVELDDGNPSHLVLNASDVDVSVRVNVTVQTDIDDDAVVTGGSISVYYDEGDDELVIENV